MWKLALLSIAPLTLVVIAILALVAWLLGVWWLLGTVVAIIILAIAVALKMGQKMTNAF